MFELIQKPTTMWSAFVLIFYSPNLYPIQIPKNPPTADSSNDDIENILAFQSDGIYPPTTPPIVIHHIIAFFCSILYFTISVSVPSVILKYRDTPVLGFVVIGSLGFLSA